MRLAAGSGGNDADRWYTAGGLLEVGGYLGTLGVPVSHWLAQGGVVRFDGAEVVTQAGSAINLSGGTLDVQSGEIRQSWLRGEDGRLYLADRAPGDLLYSGLYRGYEAVSRRWGENATRRFYNPLIAPPTRYESGYTCLLYTSRGRQPHPQPADLAQRPGPGPADRTQHVGVGRALSVSVDPAGDGLRRQHLCGHVGGLPERRIHRRAVFVDAGAWGCLLYTSRCV